MNCDVEDFVVEVNGCLVGESETVTVDWRDVLGTLDILVGEDDANDDIT